MFILWLFDGFDWLTVWLFDWFMECPLQPYLLRVRDIGTRKAFKMAIDWLIDGLFSWLIVCLYDEQVAQMDFVANKQKVDW
jgi:hypothetical protein